MKQRVTKKFIKSRYVVIDIPYTPNLFSEESPSYYTTRAEGWGCDVYVFYPERVDVSVAVCQGYDIIEKNPTQEVRKWQEFYENKAKNLIEKTRLDWRKQRYKTTILHRWCMEFVQKVLEERGIA